MHALQYMSGQVSLKLGVKRTFVHDLILAENAVDASCEFRNRVLPDEVDDHVKLLYAVNNNITPGRWGEWESLS